MDATVRNPRGMTVRGVIYVLTGCTACGKTAAALEWAERHDAEIVSCDSLLFYRGMNLGTAKPSSAELARVRHHLIDVQSVTEPMDVRSYVAMAQAAVNDIAARGRRVLVTGGSGFYLRSFFAPVADDVAVDLAVRNEIEAALNTGGLSELVRRLTDLNPEGLGDLDTQNPRRVVRALERCLVSGRPLRELQRAFAAQTEPFQGWERRVTELTRTPEDLRARIATRVAAMLRDGLIDEVEALRSAGLEQNPSAARAIGYRETLAWLDAGRLDSEALAEEITQNTWRLVRKQRTWFRTQLPAHHVVAIAAGEEAAADALFAG